MDARDRDRARMQECCQPASSSFLYPLLPCRPPSPLTSADAHSTHRRRFRFAAPPAAARAALFMSPRVVATPLAPPNLPPRAGWGGRAVTGLLGSTPVGLAVSAAPAVGVARGSAIMMAQDRELVEIVGSAKAFFKDNFLVVWEYIRNTDLGFGENRYGDRCFANVVKWVVAVFAAFWATFHQSEAAVLFVIVLLFASVMKDEVCGHSASIERFCNNF